MLLSLYLSFQGSNFFKKKSLVSSNLSQCPLELQATFTAQVYYI